jgi:hypothetical protein
MRAPGPVRPVDGALRNRSPRRSVLRFWPRVARGPAEAGVPVRPRCVPARPWRLVIARAIARSSAIRGALLLARVALSWAPGNEDGTRGACTVRCMVVKPDHLKVDAAGGRALTIIAPHRDARRPCASMASLIGGSGFGAACGGAYRAQRQVLTARRASSRRCHSGALQGRLPVMEATRSSASNDAACGADPARLSTIAVNSFQLSSLRNFFST